MSWHPVDHDLGTFGPRSGALDISAAVGSRVCAVLLKVNISLVTSAKVTINGATGSPIGGPMHGERGSGRDALLFLAYTDATGSLLDVTTTWTTTWTVLGWADATTPATTVYATAAYPTTWTDVAVGGDFLGVYKWAAAAGAVSAQMRQPADTEDIGYTANRGEFSGAGLNFAVALSEAAKVTVRDPNGSTGSIVLQVQIEDDLLTFPAAEVYDSAPVSDTWTEVSLSAYTGAVRGLALLQVNAGADYLRIGVRRKGDTADYGGYSSFPPGGTAQGYIGAGEMGYFLCETDDDGVIELNSNGKDTTVTLLAFVPEETTPTWDGVPEGSSLVTETIGGRAYDSIGFDVSTLELTAMPAGGQRQTAISGGVIQAGWTGHVLELQDWGQGPREVVVQLTAWPDDIAPGRLVSFAISMTGGGGSL